MFRPPLFYTALFSLFYLSCKSIMLVSDRTLDGNGDLRPNGQYWINNPGPRYGGPMLGRIEKGKKGKAEVDNEKK